MKKDKFINTMSILTVSALISVVLFVLGSLELTSILQDAAYLALGIGFGASVINLLSR